MSPASATSVSIPAIGVLCLSMLGGCGDDPADPIHACDYPSIQAALDDAPDGWRVLICDGVHDQAVTITRPVNLFGESRNGTVLTGGGALTIATIRNAPGHVFFHDLTLEPPAGASSTSTALSIVDSPQVTLAQLDVDLEGVPTPGLADPPAFGGLIGIDVATAGVELQHSAIRNVGFADHSSIGLRVRGLSTVQVSELAIDGTGGPAVLVSDAQVNIERSTIRRGNTDGVGVLSGDVRLADTTLEAIIADGVSVTGGYLRTSGVQVKAALRYGVLAAGGVLDLNKTRIEDAGEGIHTTFGLVAASECVIQNAREFGLYVHDSGVISFENGTVEGGEVGAFLDFADAYLTLSGTSIKQPRGRGVYVHDGQFLMTGGSIEESGGEGVWGEGGSMLLDAVTVSDSGAHGVVVTGATHAALSTITTTGNNGWGVLCDGGGIGAESSAQLEVCTGSFDDNDLGPFHLFNNCQILYLCIQL